VALNFPTSISAPGPWLISSENLLELDKLIDAQLDRLNVEKERSIESLTEEDVAGFIKAAESSDLKLNEEIIEKRRRGYSERIRQRYDANDDRTVTFFLTEGRTVTSARFKTAIGHPGVANETPRGLSVFWRVGTVKLRLRLGGQLSWHNKLELEVEPSESEAAQELFGAVQNWMGNIQAPTWVQLAQKYRFGIFMCLFLSLSLALMVWGQYKTESQKWAYQEEARSLVAKGINSQNQQKAIELLLAIASDYRPSQRESAPGPRFWAITLVVGLGLGALLITPNMVIGVWGGKAALKRWNAWLKFLGVTIPTLIFTTIFWRQILSALGIGK
jgi:hypothetical protein